MSHFPRPPHESKFPSRAWTQWFNKLGRYLSASGRVAWNVLSFTGSKLTDLEDRKHADLQEALSAEPESDDIVRDKHVSNADLSLTYNHTSSRLNPHEVTKDQIGLSLVENYKQLRADSLLFDLADKAVARSNIGLELGVDVEPHSDNLTAISAVATAGIVVVAGSGIVHARSVSVGSGKLIVLNGDGSNGDIVLDVVEGEISHQNLSGAGTKDHVDVDAHIDAINPHSDSASQADFSGHTGSVNPHIDSASVTSLTAHKQAVDAHPGYVLDSELAGHTALTDAHPGLATTVDLNSHISEGNPHSSSAGSSELTSHVGAENPHTGSASKDEIAAHVASAHPTPLSVEAVSSDFEIIGNKVYLCDCTSGTLKGTLPTNSGSFGITFHVKKIDSTPNPVIIEALGNGGLIDGEGSLLVTNKNDSVMVTCDGTDWRIL